MRQNVSQNAHWSLDGLDPDVRDAARDAARRAGMSLDEWLAATIADRAGRAYAEAPVRRRATAAGAGGGAAYTATGYDDLEGAASRLGKVTRGNPPPNRVQTASRNLDHVIAQLTAEQDRRARESAAKTAEALDSVARWIERAEERMGEASRAVSERQDRTATVLGEALGLMTRRLDDIERRVSEGHQPSMNAALKAVEKVEQHLTKLDQRRREEAAAAAERDDAKAKAMDAKIEAALRGFEARIATISERISETVAAPRGRRGVSVKDELQEAVAEIRSRQKALDDPEAAASPPPLPAPRMRPTAEPVSTREGRSHAEILEGLRGEIAKLAGQLETVRPRPNEAVPAVEAVREEIADLRETVAGLATRTEVGQLEDILRALARETSQAMLQAKLGQGGPETAAMAQTLQRLEGEVRRLSDEVTRNSPAKLTDHFDALAHKLDLVADNGLDPQAVQVLGDQIAEMRAHLGEIAEPTRVDALVEEVAALSQRIEHMARERIDPFEFATVRSAVEEIRGVVTSRDARSGTAEITALSERIDTLAEKLSGVEGVLSRSDIGALSKQIESLARSASRLDDKAGVPDLGPLAMQIEALSGRIDALAETRPGIDVSPVARQIEALEKRLAEGGSAVPPAALVSRLDVLADKLDGLRESRAEPPLDVDGLLRRLDRIDARLEEPRSDDGRLEGLLADLAAKLERPASGNDGLETLERQIAEIAARLDRGPTSDPALATLERTMGDLMAQVRGLEDGLRETVATPPAPLADPAFADIARSIESLKSSQAEAEKRSRETLGAVHTTLEALVSRLATLETGAAAATPAARKPRAAETAPAAQAQAQAPGRKPRAEAAAPVTLEKPSDRPAGGLDLSAFREPRRAAPAPMPEPMDTSAIAILADADAPAPPVTDEILLEPGTGRPTPGAARRPMPEESDGSDIKASFIAAARRAAQSAAAEAAAAAQRDRPGTPGRSEKAGLGARLKATLASRRRPLLLGLAAIVLAIGALQVSSMFRGAPAVDEAPPVAITEPAPAPQADTAAPAPALAPAPAPAPRVIEGVPVPEDGAALDAGSPVTTESLGPAPARTFMGLPATALTNGIPASDLVIPAPRPAGAAAGVPLPPRRDGAAAVTATTTEVAATAAPTMPVAAIVADIEIPASVAPANLRNAALAGDRAALFELASRLSEGRDAMRDPELAARLFERLAEDGNIPAQYRIGQIYDKGVGLPRDAAAAEIWYRRAAESGNVTAMHNLAVLLAEGAVGGQPDYTSAIGWFRRAAEHGVRDSQYNLAVLLARGLGTPQDLSASYTWFAIAADQGDTDAAARRDELAGRLGAGEEALARSAADAWRPETPDPIANEVALPANGWNDRQASLTGRVASFV